MRYHTCFVRLMHKQTSLQFAMFEAHMFREYTSQEFCKVTACRSHTVDRSKQSPDPSITFLSFRRASEHFTRSPVSTRRSNHAAYSRSPRTDNGDDVGANTSSLTVVAKSFSTHRNLTSLPFVRRAQPVSRIDLSGGMSVSLTQGYSCRSLLNFSIIASLDFVGGKSFDQGTLVACSNNQVCVRPSFLVDIELHIVLTTDVKNVSCHSCLLRHVSIVD